MLSTSSKTDRPASNDLRWAVCGAAGGLALSAVMLGLRLLTGVPSLPEVTNDRLLAIVPGSFTSAMIDRFGFGAKPLLLIGWQAGLLVGGVVLALLFGRWVARRPGANAPRRLADRGVRLGLGYWFLVEAVLLTLIGVGPLGSHRHDGVASAMCAVFAFAAYGLVLAGFWLLIAPRPATAEQRAVAPADPTRRRVLSAAAGVGLAVAAGGTLKRIADMMGEQGSGAVTAQAPGANQATPAPAAAAAAVPAAAAATGGTPGAAAVFDAPTGISQQITPPASFYVISKNEVDPIVKAADWSLDVRGMVDAPHKFSYSEVLALPATNQFATLECISNAIGGDLISNGYWTGVPLATLLDQVHTRPGAKLVVFTSADGYKESLPIDKARQPNVLLAHTLAGEPIADKHGFPLRVITPGLYGMKNPKWLTRIELTDAPITGFWEQSGWDPGAGIQTMARFDTRPVAVHAGQPFALGGVAFAGDRGISAVEVSADGGKTWSAAALQPPISPLTWALWSFSWTPEKQASYTLKVRAVDGRGATQTSEGHESYSSGATGYDSLHVKAT